MRVFITGGSGYIGRSTIEALIRHGGMVTALARTEHSARIVSGLGAVPVAGTLTDVDVLREGARQADGVIHLGGTTPRAQRRSIALRRRRRRRAREVVPTCTPAGCGCTAIPTGSSTRTPR
ncbi:NAD-dependent epimerase/dehydratase family protein [Streptomyces sp. NPDC002545]